MYNRQNKLDTVETYPADTTELRQGVARPGGQPTKQRQ